jgi:hypothetical protein
MFGTGNFGVQNSTNDLSSAGVAEYELAYNYAPRRPPRGYAASND